MPAVTTEQFKKLNLMAGTVKSLAVEALTEEDIEVWERDFALLCDDLGNLVDPELGNDLRAEKSFYDEAVKVAKGYFDKIPFGGLKAATGQYGFRLITPQDLKNDATGAIPALYSWVQTAIMTTSARSFSDWGASGTLSVGASAASQPIYVRNAANKQEVMAFHRLISYKPSPRIIHVRFNINDFPYVPYAVEPYSKITKQNKLFKIIPIPGRVILHPGSHMYITFWFDTLTGAVTPPAVRDVIDIEIALFGLVFGQYDYLASAELV
ncbi:hypothetical protein ES705_08815 [subsurface metagenome]